MKAMTTSASISQSQMATTITLNQRGSAGLTEELVPD